MLLSVKKIGIGYILVSQIISNFDIYSKVKGRIKKENDSIFEAERLSNFGNDRLIRYPNHYKNQKKTNGKNKKNIKECKDLYDLIDRDVNLKLALCDFIVINGQTKFKIGPSLRNSFDDIYVNIPNFLIKKTKVSKSEYKNFLKGILNFLKNKKEGNVFYSSVENIKKKFLGKSKDKNKNNIPKKHIEQEEMDNKYIQTLENYIKLREDLIANLTDDYIKFLLPMVKDYKDNEINENKFVEEYILNDKYDNYPITFINYYQYVEYCKWQTFIVNEYLFNKSTKKNRAFIVFYPISYAEYLYAACCGDNRNLYGCGSFNIIDSNDNFKFNFNDRRNNTDIVNMTPVDKYQPNPIGVYDCNGNSRIWFRSNTADYTSKDNKNYEDNEYFQMLLDESVPTKDVNINSLSKKKLIKMTSKGDCNSRLEDVQNGKFKDEHVLSSNPYLGFTLAAKVLIFN